MAKVNRGAALETATIALNNLQDIELVASGVRISLDWPATDHTGRSVEVRVPPYRVVQILEGTTHLRSMPPAVVEMSPETWNSSMNMDLNAEDTPSRGRAVPGEVIFRRLDFSCAYMSQLRHSP